MPAIFLTHVLAIFHLHESNAYYIAPTCWLLWELSSLAPGNNCKLLLLVICHLASAIIHAHRNIVFWTGGDFVFLRFQLYGTISREVQQLPSEPKSTDSFHSECMFLFSEIGKMAMAPFLLVDLAKEGPCAN